MDRSRIGDQIVHGLVTIVSNIRLVTIVSNIRLVNIRLVNIRLVTIVSNIQLVTRSVTRSITDRLWVYSYFIACQGRVYNLVYRDLMNLLQGWVAIAYM